MKPKELLLKFLLWLIYLLGGSYPKSQNFTEKESRHLYWLSQLDWPVMLERMMKEVPQEFLEPKYLEISPAFDQKPAGRLTEAEKRLWGVVRWLESRIELEVGAHEVLHENLNDNLSPAACAAASIGEYLGTAKMNQAFSGIVLSLKERLKLPESLFFFHGEDIYPFQDSVISRIKFDFQKKQREGSGEDQNQILENWAMEQLTYDPKKIH